MRSPRAMAAWGKIWHQFIWEAFNQSSWCQPLPLPQLPNDLVPPILKLFWVLQCELACLWHPSLKFLRFQAFPVFPFACYILKICWYLLFCHLLFFLCHCEFILLFSFPIMILEFCREWRYMHTFHLLHLMHRWFPFLHLVCISITTTALLLWLRLLLLLGQKEVLWVFGSNFISK